MLTFLVSVLFIFYIQGVLILKKFRPQRFNELVYKTHLECNEYWISLWQHIQADVDAQLSTVMDNNY
jgi:hypothetical protein